MAEYIEEKDAENVMKEIGVCEKGIDIMKDKSNFRLILLKEVRNAMANIVKQEMLALGGDAAVNAGCVNCTVEKSDVMIMGTNKQIKGLVEKMKSQVNESKDVASDIEMLIK